MTEEERNKILGYIISTDSHTYNLEDTNNPKIKLISGGKYHQNEICILSEICEEKPFKAAFTDNPCNNGLSGNITISGITSINTTPFVQIARPNVQRSNPVEHSGQFFVIDNIGRDIGRILQKNRFDIEENIGDELGLPESIHQKVFVSPSVYNKNNISQCVVIFANFDYPDDDIVANHLKSEVLSVLDNNCGCSETMFIEKSNLHFVEQNYSDKALGLDTSSRLKQSFTNMTQPTMTNTTPIFVKKQALLSPDF